MNNVTTIGKKAAKQGRIIAKIGNRLVRVDELNAAINVLPDTLRTIYSTPEGKLKFLRSNYITKELLYDLALRKGIDKREEIQSKLKELKKNLLAQEAMREEFGTSLSINPQEMTAFYEARKDSVYQGKKLEDIQDKVVQDFTTYKQDSLSRSLMAKLYGSETVEVYPESLGVSGETIKFGEQ